MFFYFNLGRCTWKTWARKEDNIQMDLQDVGCGDMYGIALRTGTGGGRLWMLWWTFGFHILRGVSWLAEGLLASQAGLCFMELLQRDCSPQALAPRACVPVWLAGRIQRRIQPASEPNAGNVWALCNCRQLSYTTWPAQASKGSPHGCLASTHVVCSINVTADTDTVKWHNLCTRARACVCVCVYVFM